MRRIKMSEIISRSIDRTTDILFKPFSLKKWLLLAFIASFAGSMFFGGNIGGGGSSPYQADTKKAVSEDSKTPASQVAEKPGEEKGTSEASKEKASEPSKTAAVVIISIVAAAIVIMVLFIIAMCWISAHFSFIWFNAVTANDASIIGPFQKHRPLGRSLFRVCLFFTAAFIISVIVTALWIVINVVTAGAFDPGFVWTFSVALKLFLAPAVFIILMLAVIFILSVIIDNFTVMVMALDKLTFMKAFKKTMRFVKDNAGDVTLFYLISFCLWLASSAMILFIALALLLVIVLAGAILIGIGYIVLMAFLKLKVLFIIYCIVVGLPLFIIFLIASICAQVPFAVFFRIFSIEYMCSFEGTYTEGMLDAYVNERPQGSSRMIVILPVAIILIFLFIAIAGLGAAIAIPNFIRARNVALAAEADRCTTNLKAVESAKAVWAKEVKAGEGAKPEWKDLVPGYLTKKPECPKGGVYAIGDISAKPQCSIGDNKSEKKEDDHIIK